MLCGTLGRLTALSVFALLVHSAVVASPQDRRGGPLTSRDSDLPTESVGPVSFVVDSGLFYTAQGTPLVEICMQVPYDQLPFIKEGGGYVARVDVVAVFEGVSGHQVGGDSWNREIWVQDYEETMDPATTYRARARFALPAGKYALRLTCGGSGSDVKGEAYRVLEVRRPPDYPEALSDIMFGTCVAEGDSAVSIPVNPDSAPAAEGEFVPNAGRIYGVDTGPACVQAEAYSFDGGSGDTVKVKLAVLNENENVVWNNYETVLKTGTVTPLEFRVPVDSLAWGGYRLAIDLVSGNVEASRSRHFEVDESRVAAGMDLKQLIDLMSLVATDEELETLASLPESERQDYLDEIWRKRDPDPTTPRNEFMVAFFKRYKEAKLKFNENGVPGWKTDRGKVYIRNGPPDRIETRPGVSGSLSPYATYEIWYYDATNSHYVFEDFGGTGSYTLVETVQG
jgi:GWxTD domain-containing protein